MTNNNNNNNNSLRRRRRSVEYPRAGGTGVVPTERSRLRAIESGTVGQGWRNEDEKQIAVQQDVQVLWQGVARANTTDRRGAIH